MKSRKTILRARNQIRRSRELLAATVLRERAAPEPSQPSPESLRRLTQLDCMVTSGGFSQLDVVSFSLRSPNGGIELQGEEAPALLEQVRAGKPIELDMEVIAFQQPKDKARPLPLKLRKLANRNFVTFREKDLDRLARSFVGRPFLRDHNRSELLAKGGKITRSELIEKRGMLQISQTVRLVKPWAVEAALDGTLDSFSIGMDPSDNGPGALQDSVFCSVDGKRMFSFECGHIPGTVAKVANSEESVIVEAEFRKPVGAELSGVTFPAVAGTKVETVQTPSGGKNE